MLDELSNEDWHQIALYYQRKYNELELTVLGLELKVQKAQESAAEEDSE
jgi:hypothetical protein